MRLLAIITFALASATDSDSPPDSLIRENLHRAALIVGGTIESTDAPRPGVTVAHFRVDVCYRGKIKPGQEVSYASFKEGDRYNPGLLHKKLIVFLRKRAPRYAPPAWETATDLSEFLDTRELAAKLPKPPRRMLK